MPTEDYSLSDQLRITHALEALGYENVRFPLPVLRKLYPACRDWGYELTVTLVNRETEWVVTHIQQGDCTRQHYGLAVDYGSTTIVMELLDLTTGQSLARETMVNGQVAFGTDILTRITYTMEDPANTDILRRATADTFNALLKKLTDRTGIDAAAYTMIECLLETAGCEATDLSHAWLSGAFTAHSDLNAAITIGMFPDLPREKYTCIANTSLEGAKILLQDRSRLAEARKLAGDMYCVQFASIPDFIVRMRAAKFIPHTDLARFPSIRDALPENRT